MYETVFITQSLQTIFVKISLFGIVIIPQQVRAIITIVDGSQSLSKC